MCFYWYGFPTGNGVSPGLCAFYGYGFPTGNGVWSGSELSMDMDSLWENGCGAKQSEW